MNRRELLKAAAALPLAQTVFSNAASAQAAYPSRNITMAGDLGDFVQSEHFRLAPE